MNENGKLCLDISLDAGGGYNVDWTGYKFEKSSVSSNRCDLTLCAVSEEPGENTVAEYKVSVTLQYENGNGCWPKCLVKAYNSSDVLTDRV